MSDLPFVMEKDDRMVRAALDGEILAKQGAMVAYTGKVDFAFKGAGVGGMIRKAVTGEGQELMRVTGAATCGSPTMARTSRCSPWTPTGSW